jgi:hypothetical protein
MSPKQVGLLPPSPLPLNNWLCDVINLQHTQQSSTTALELVIQCWRLFGLRVLTRGSYGKILKARVTASLLGLPALLDVIRARCWLHLENISVAFQVPLMLPVFYRICSLWIVLLPQERKIEDPCRILPQYASAI